MPIVDVPSKDIEILCGRQNGFDLQVQHIQSYNI
jgi:hypothetical protein